MSGAPLRAKAAVVAAALVAVLAGCGSSSESAAPEAAVTAPVIAPSGSGPYQPEAAAPSGPTCGNVESSVPPLAPLPAPAALPAGSYEAMVKARGYLIAGVDQNTYLFAYRDPTTGQLSGFDIDMIRQIAQAIFGNPGAVRYVIVPNDQRVSAVQSGKVDVVAETMTITCQRKQDVNFSAVYLRAGERILAAKTSGIDSTKALAGKRVCATVGSTSLANLAALHLSPAPTLIQVQDQADCLVMLQQDQVDAASTDDTILYGLAAQDPNLAVMGASFSQEPYGMALPKSRPDFTAFVNAVLANEKADGTWASIYSHWLGPVTGGATPAPPVATYSP